MRASISASVAALLVFSTLAIVAPPGAGAGGEAELSAQLDQSSGPPGDGIELTASGCTGSLGVAALFGVGASGNPDIGSIGHPYDIGDNLLSQFDVLDGQFSGVVPVGAAVQPGSYQVGVWCLEGEEILSSVALAYTVLAAAAPVPAAPEFTG